jgi:hypothetical protein
MFPTSCVVIVALGIAFVSLASPAAAAAKCTSIQARCAVEIGGTCDPTTGRWEYGRRGMGGNSQAFNACISRKSGKAR